MTNIERFHETVGILVKAYLNGTLMHANCYACAVGNMVAEGLKTTVLRDHSKRFDSMTWSNGFSSPAIRGWGALFCSEMEYDENGKEELVQEINEDALEIDSVREQIEATGYDWRDLAKIEFAFESHRRDDEYNEDVCMFNGLMAVVDVLADIHKVDLSVKESAKTLFAK